MIARGFFYVQPQFNGLRFDFGNMKISKLLLGLGAMISSIIAQSTSAQTSPVLGAQLYAGVTITGTTGGLYAVQASTDPSNSNSWSCVALVQLPATNYLWTDTSKTTSTGQRFYRTVLMSTNLVSILPGTFTMGSPTNEALRNSDEAQHVVTLSRSFYMGKYPVTQGEYLAIRGSNPSSHTGDPNYPVEHVRWVEATNYCGLRTAQEQAAGLIPTNWVYRLPTESEWEYACRAGRTTAFYLGSALRSQQANFAGTNEYDAAIGNIPNPSGVRVGDTTVVGSYAPNGWGLYDMAGNVQELCQDWYDAYPSTPVTDPQGPASGSQRVFRGGAFSLSAVDCRSAVRAAVAPNSTGFRNGFRVVLARVP